MCSNNQKDVTMGNQQRSTYNTTRKKTHNEFVNEIISKYSNQFFILTRYVKNNEKVLFRHNSHECGYHCFFKRPNDILSSNQGCPKCAVEKSRKKQKTFEDEYFNTVQKHDSIKNEYCITNNINLIRIPYTSFKTIDKILEDKIISKRSTTIPGEGVGSSDPKQ